MAKIDVEFRVRINEIISKTQKVFVCGSSDGIGNWYPRKAKSMSLQETSQSNKYQIWSTYVMLNVADVKYRYFIGETDDNHEISDERTLIVTSWESNVTPRVKNIYSELINSTMHIERTDFYGFIDDHCRLLHGWLIDQTVVQVRLGGIECVRLYKSRNKLKRIFFKCKYYNFVKEGCSDDESDSNSDEIRNIDFKQAKACKLTENNFLPKEVPKTGIEFCGGYLIFQFETMDFESTGIELELYQMLGDISRTVTPSSSISKLNEIAINGTNSPSNQTANLQLTGPMDTDMVLIGVARLAMMPLDRIEKTVPIYDNINRPVGEIKLDVNFVTPLLGHRFTMEYTYQKHWKFRKTLNVGHKGSGTSYGHPNTTMSSYRENTIYSLKNAFEHGADYVEFDVQMSKDLVPVLYHDFQVATILRKKRKDDMQYMEVPVKDLTLRDLHALKVYHTSILNTSYPEHVETEDVDPEELNPFPTLESCLEAIDPALGFNIELKYPQEMHDGDNEQVHYVNRNVFLDHLLHVVVRHAHSRRIIFSSFDPDICFMINMKQNRFPVMFLCQGEVPSNERYKDPRTQTIERSMYFALSSNLLGLCVLSRALVDKSDLVKKILDNKLILFLWGEENNDSQTQKLWREHGVHGIIFDRIHEFQSSGSKNVFTMDYLEQSPPNGNSHIDSN